MPSYESSNFNPPAPVARVMLRNPETRASVPDVPMLMDSGADVTLVPLRVILSLGVSVQTDREFELIDYQGTSSKAHGARVDLVFLGRAFKGLFLVTDQDSGVLGREILNHIPLLLDGPALNWEEYRKS